MPFAQPPSGKFDVIIIGAGISGLTCAFNLHRAGKRILVLEKSSHVGGAIRSARMDSFLVEAGPNSTLETTPLLREIISASGCAGEMQYANTASDTRFILKGGKLVPLPMSPGAFIRTNLFSTSAKLRLFKEPFIAPSSPSDEETISQFVLRRLGGEFLDYAINPFVAGVYAGNPDQLSVKAAFPKLHALEQKYGSLIKGQIKGARERKRNPEQSKQSAKMFSFNDGMETLPKAIAQHVGESIITEFSLEKILPERKDESSRWEYRIEGSRTETPMRFEADAIILAVPSYAAAEIMNNVSPSCAANLRAMYYPPCSVVVSVFNRADVRNPLDGFGYLIPQKEQRKILGTIFSSTIFSNRCADEYVMLTSFVGGSRNPEFALLAEDKLHSLVLLELSELLGASARPVFLHSKQWEKAIPQYTLSHLDRIAALERFENEHRGFYFCANYRGGISVGDCVKSAFAITERIARDRL